jgi:hypothetical protein
MSLGSHSHISFLTTLRKKSAFLLYNTDRIENGASCVVAVALLPSRLLATTGEIHIRTQTLRQQCDHVRTFLHFLILERRLMQ